MGLLFAAVTVLAWGTWLAPSQNVPLRNQQVRTFHVALTNLVLASVVAVVHGLDGLTAAGIWLPFLGGLIWAVAGLGAFTATADLGLAKAVGLWAPLNILVSLLCGWWLFGEFRQPSTLQRWGLFVAISCIIAGVALIASARTAPQGGAPSRSVGRGLLGAITAGVLWGVYFIPIQLSGVSMWVGALPLAAGMWVGALTLLLATKTFPILPDAASYARVSATGLLWSIGNYGMLLLVRELGAGKGFTIAQLSIVVNAALGIYVFRQPPRGTSAARLTLAGCVLATVGGAVLGALK